MLEQNRWTEKWHEAVRVYGLLHEAAYAVEVKDFETAGAALYEALQLLWDGELKQIGDWLTVKEATKLTEKAFAELDYAGCTKVLTTLKDAMRALRRVRKMLAELANKGGERQ
jgi:hypothetical protein